MRVIPGVFFLAATLASQCVSAQVATKSACLEPRTPPDQRVEGCTVTIRDAKATATDRFAAYVNRARAYFAKQDWTRSVEDYDAAILIQPDIAEIFNERGVARERNGERELAISDYSTAIKLNPEYALAYGNRGLARYKRGVHDLAKTDFDTAIRLNPQYGAAFNGRGVIVSLMGDQASAIADFTSALRLNPNYASAYNNRGIAYAKHRQFAQAIADLTQAIRLAPDNPDFQNELAWTYLRAGNPALGLPHANRALALAPKHANAYDTRGAIYEALGSKTQAAADREKAYALNPDLSKADRPAEQGASARAAPASISDVVRFVEEQGWLANFGDICGQFETAQHDEKCVFKQISVQETEGRGDPRGFNVSTGSATPYLVIYHLGPLVGEFFVVSRTGELIRAYYRSKGAGYTRVPNEEARAEFQTDLGYWTSNLSRLRQGMDDKRKKGGKPE